MVTLFFVSAPFCLAANGKNGVAAPLDECASLRASIDSSNGSAKEAIAKDLEEAANKNTASSCQLYALGLIHTQNKDHDAGLVALERSLLLNPENPYAMTTLGYIALERKEYETAEKHLTQALEIKPDYTPAFTSLKYLYTLTQRQDMIYGLALKYAPASRQDKHMKAFAALMYAPPGMPTAEKLALYANVLEYTVTRALPIIPAALILVFLFISANAKSRQPGEPPGPNEFAPMLALIIIYSSIQIFVSLPVLKTMLPDYHPAAILIAAFGIMFALDALIIRLSLRRSGQPLHAIIAPGEKSAIITAAKHTALIFATYTVAMTIIYNTLPQLFHRLTEPHPVLGVFSFEQMALTKYVFFVFIALVGPVIEELLFRGVLYTAIKKRFGIRPAILLSASVFALWHIELQLLLFSFLTGVFLAIAYEETKSLRAPIAAHVGINSVVTLLYLFK